VKGITTDVIKRVTKEIPVANSKLYNVILIRKINDVVNETYIVKANVVTYNARGFEKVKKNYMYMGYSTMILLHDPSLMKQEPVNSIARHKQFEIERKADAILKDKQAKEREDLIEQLKADEVKEQGGDSTPPATPPVNTEGIGELEGIDVGFSVPDAPLEKVIEFSKENKISLKGEKDDAKIRRIVIDWLIAEKKKS